MQGFLLGFGCTRRLLPIEPQPSGTHGSGSEGIQMLRRLGIRHRSDCGTGVRRVWRATQSPVWLAILYRKQWVWGVVAIALVTRCTCADRKGKQPMEMKHWLSAAVSCLALALWALPVAAAPVSIATTSPKVAADGNSIVETTHWRRRDAYYFSEHSPDDFDRYYPYDEPSYGCFCSYPSYHYYHVLPRYRYYGHHQHRHYHHHRHHRHHRDDRRW